jgi:hypothetical protein
LVVGIVARISGAPNQKEQSLQDQQDHVEQVVQQPYDGPVEYRVVATTGKGESLERPELRRSKRLRTSAAWSAARMRSGSAASPSITEPA